MTDEPQPNKDGGGTAKSRYQSLVSNRQPYLTRAYDCCELTIPSLLPRMGHTAATVLPTPWQGQGARCVNNLASKLLQTALPSNQPFFRMKIDEILVKQMMDQGQDGKNLKTELDAGLAVLEKAVMTEVEVTGDRVSAFEAFKHLVATGNALLHDAKGGLRVYFLDHYVVRRDPAGNPLEIIVLEQIDPDVLPVSIRQLVAAEANEQGEATVHAAVDLYTRIVRGDSHWKISQEVAGVVIPDTHGTYPLDKSPWIPLRFTKIDGEDYGRGYVEEYLGDFRTCEDLSQALAEGAKAAAKLLLLVKPNGTTRLKTIQDAKNGDICSGNAEEVTVLQANKFADFQTAEKRLVTIEQRLEMAFLLNSGVQRKGERVTAEEIRFMAQELETTLGGFYTILSKEFQLPYVKSKMTSMQKQNRLPALPKGLVRPSIVTGMDALGRSMDRQRLVGFMTTATQVFGPEIVAQYIDVSEGLKRLATSDGIDTDALVKSAEQVAAAQQQQQQQAMMKTLGPNAVTAGGKLMEGVMKNGNKTGVAAGGGGPVAAG